MMRTFGSWLIIAAIAISIVLVERGMIPVPPRWNPWAPLDVAETPNLLTRFKLSRLDRDPGACLAALRTAGFRVDSVPDRTTGPGCGFRNVVELDQAGIPLEGASTLSCPAAVALALWERHAVQPAAKRALGARVVRIESFGSYACRNVYGRENAPRSEHATANAIDIAGFVLADGRRVRVVNDWAGATQVSQFLHETGAGACRFFDAVLGPDYNAAHRDHLHLDRGPYHFCR